MRQVWKWTNSRIWAKYRSLRSPLSQVDGNGIRADGAQTGDQERRTEALSIHLTIYLVGRLVDSQLRKHFRKLLVSDAPPHHFTFYQLFRGLLPSVIRLSQLATLAWQFFHHVPSPLTGPLPNLCRNSLTTIFSRIRPKHNFQRYTFSAHSFLEDKLLRRPFTAHSGARLPYLRDAK